MPQYQDYAEALSLVTGDKVLFWQNSNNALKTAEFSNFAASVIATAPGTTYPYTLVASFGAIGDGVTDDTAAIIEAIAAAGPGGVVVFSPDKVYLVTGALNIPYDNMIFIGSGATIIGSGQTDICRFQVYSRTGIEISGFVLDGAYLNDTGNINQGLIDVIASTNCRFYGNVLQNTSNCGIRIIGTSSKISVVGNRFSAYWAGIFTNQQDDLNQPHSLTITGNYLGQQIPPSGPSAGITMHGTANDPYGGHVISGNIVEASVTVGIEVQFNVNSCTVSNNVVFGAGFGITLSQLINTTATGNSIRATYAVGLEFAGCTNGTAAGNMIDGRLIDGTTGDGAGLGVYPTCTDITISGNLITGYTGAQLDIQDSDNVIVSGNHIIMQAGTSTSGGRCLVAKDYTNLRIDSNVFRSIAGAGFIFLDSTDQTCSGLSLTNNTFIGSVDTSGVGFYEPGNGHENILICGNNTANASAPVGMIDFFGPGFVRKARCYGNLGPGGQTNATNLDFPVLNVSADTTLTFRNNVVVVDATGAARTITLPSAANESGLQFMVTKSDSGGNAVHVASTGGETFNGNAGPYDLTGQWDRATFVSDGTNWLITQSN